MRIRNGWRRTGRTRNRDRGRQVRLSSSQRVIQQTKARRRGTTGRSSTARELVGKQQIGHARRRVDSSATALESQQLNSTESCPNGMTRQVRRESVAGDREFSPKTRRARAELDVG